MSHKNEKLDRILFQMIVIVYNNSLYIYLKSNKKICKYFLAGKCENPNCTFLHQKPLSQKAHTQPFQKVLFYIK